jgi:hypothetical protein
MVLAVLSAALSGNYKPIQQLQTTSDTSGSWQLDGGNQQPHRRLRKRRGSSLTVPFILVELRVFEPLTSTH